MLSLADDVRSLRSGTDAYINDVIVNCDLVSPSRVMDHLAQYGLVTKQPEMINDARALGLQIRQIKLGQLMWSFKAIHDVHHLGIDPTHYLAKLEDLSVTRGKVGDVISSCT